MPSLTTYAESACTNKVDSFEHKLPCDTGGGVMRSDENDRIKINYPGTGNNSQFTYDGWKHVVQIVETVSSTVTSTKQFVWSNGRMREARNASGTVTAQYFGLGETIGGTNYYWTLDELGSIREMTSSAGTLLDQRTYDLYGRVTRIQGSVASDLQFAGYYCHAPSGLNLTTNRAYSSTMGRWINRDPIEERGGNNLYGYVNNSPLIATDPSGLAQAAGTGKCRSCMDCGQIADKIGANVGELAKRSDQLVNDIKTLPWYGPRQTIESHIEKYNELQGFLSDCLALYVFRGCSDPLPPDSDYWQTAPAPHPAPTAWDPFQFNIPKTGGPPGWVWVIFVVPFPGNPVFGGI